MQYIHSRLEMLPWEFVLASRILYNLQRQAKSQERKRTEKDIVLLWAPALCQTTQSWEVEKSLRCTRLTKLLRWPCMRLAKIEKQGETKMIRCLEVALYQSSESSEWRRKKRFSCRFIPRPLCGCKLSRFHLCLSHSTHTYILGYKKTRKEKKQTIFLYISIVVVLCYTSMWPVKNFFCIWLNIGISTFE